MHSKLFVLSLAVAGWVLQPDAAGAQVIEIADDGSAVTYAAPTVFTANGAVPIVRHRTVLTPAFGVRDTLAAAAAAHKLDPALLDAVAWRESRFRPDALSSKGAAGVMQLMPGTARDLGVDRFDVAQNIHGGAAYLSAMLTRFGDPALALAAYNAGPGAVERYRGVPPYAETRAYVTAVLARAASTPKGGGPVMGVAP